MARLRARLRAAAPSAGVTFVGAAVWGLAIAACAAYGLYADGWQTTARTREVLIIYVAGAFASFPLALYAARFLALGRSRDVAFAAFLLALGCITIGITATIYALDYRNYYTQWHAEPFTVTWMFQFGFTVAGALYQFAVLGLRLYMPFGLLALLVAAIWFARQPR
jgi:hypothetical protein